MGPLPEETKNALVSNKVGYTNYTQLTNEQVAARYAEADIVSFVSTHEGFGMPIVEAQSIERVCVTSNCSSMPEVAGEGACLVDPFDVSSIRHGFERVTRDNGYREFLLAAGRQNKRRFNANEIALSYAALYQSVYQSNQREPQ